MRAASRGAVSRLTKPLLSPGGGPAHAWRLHRLTAAAPKTAHVPAFFMGTIPSSLPHVRYSRDQHIRRRTTLSTCRKKSNQYVQFWPRSGGQAAGQGKLRSVSACATVISNVAKARQKGAKPRTFAALYFSEGVSDAFDCFPVSCTNNTGTSALRTTPSASLPMANRRIPRRPCVPMTMRSAGHCFACPTIKSAAGRQSIRAARRPL